jgi:hypothetical protein
VLSGLWKRRWLSGVDSMEVSASVAVERIEDLLVKEKAAILERESDKREIYVLLLSSLSHLHFQDCMN